MRSLLSALAAILTLAACASAPATAEPAAFPTGPIIANHGKVAAVPDAAPLPAGTKLKVAFDVGEGAEPGKENRYIGSAARFLNLHGAAGVPAENMQVAVVIHGSASADLLDTADNATAPLIKALIAAGVRVELCGQTAAYRGIAKQDIISGITITQSAMTSHALLQQDGFTLNPF